MWFFVDYIFVVMLVFSTMVVLTASSWFIMWFGFEVNMMSYIAFVGGGESGYFEVIYSYFFIQVLGSIALFFFCLVGMINFGWGVLFFDSYVMETFLIIVLMMKMGAGPFYFWFPSVSGGLGWMSMFVLMTWQKLAPLWVLGTLVMNGFLYGVFGVFTVFVGSLGGVNQFYVRSIFAYSSISHLGWMMMLFFSSDYLGLLYYLCYVILTFSAYFYFFGGSWYSLIQLYFGFGGLLMLFGFFVSIFSLGGMPPFFGFFPKMVAVQSILGLVGGFILLLIVLLGLLSLFYYLRLCYSIFVGWGGWGEWGRCSLWVSSFHVGFVGFNFIMFLFFMFF